MLFIQNSSNKTADNLSAVFLDNLNGKNIFLNGVIFMTPYNFC
jgi:hypothetical protein